MKASPIYNIIRSDRTGDKSFGCSEYFEQDIRVGASKVNSFSALKVSVKVTANEKGLRSFMVFVDDEPVKAINYYPTRGNDFEVIDLEA